MVMASAESSLSRGRKVVVAPNKMEQRSLLTVATLQIIEERPHQRSNRKQPGGFVRHFDNTDPRYGWLLPGWVAEERRVQSGRLYKYYYDPSGRQYRTQSEVLYTWEKSGLVCIDV